ncbi:MAG: gamma-glutamyltransferase [Dehalococcoidia bacterium]
MSMSHVPMAPRQTPTPRDPVYASEAIVAADHPLAVAAGARVLQDGGNAVDAAIAVSAVLVVTKPNLSHLGGDAFLQVYWAGDGTTVAISSGGQAPRGATAELFQAEGGIPTHGVKAATIPGLVDAWAVAHRRWGTQPLASLLAPAIHYAKDSFPLSQKVAWTLEQIAPFLARFPTTSRLFLKDGRSPQAGEVLMQGDVARTLEAIAQGGSDAFYRGDIAQRIARFCHQEGGLLTEEDLAEYYAETAEPIHTDYRGYTVYEQPPNSQGHILLEALNIVEAFDLSTLLPQKPAVAIHLMVEAIKLAFADRDRYAGDPRYVDMPLAMLLSRKHAAERRRQIDTQRVGPLATPAAERGDTTSFVVADRWGNMVTFIQSVFYSFGCGVVAGDTGVLLNNRLSRFSLAAGHPNRLEPGKRTMHTLNTYMVFKDGSPLLVGGTPGGDYQVQTNLQVLTNLLDLGLDVQRAIDAPRWGYTAELGLQLEERFPEAVVQELRALGHQVSLLHPWAISSGRAQVIVRDPHTGSYVAGSDSRGEGCALGI